jgi:hypothetical protein
MWLFVGGLLFLIGRAVVFADNEDGAQTPVGRIEWSERSANPQWVTVKYRDTPVNVASGSFTHWLPLSSQTGNVRQVWYAANSEYMLIQLGGTVYHYCDFSAYQWNALLGADNVDSHYALFIRGGALNDCRYSSVPQFP